MEMEGGDGSRSETRGSVHGAPRRGTEHMSVGSERVG
jgi:hypothetical protein